MTRIILAALLFSFLPACLSDVETVETRDAEGRLERFERRKKDFARHGKYRRFYENGKASEESDYRNDTLHGERKFFYQNGATESIESFKNGVHHGPYKKFYENGALQVEQVFVEGAMQGLSTAWYPNGVVREKVTMRDNLENGPFQEYYESGTLKAEGFYAPDGDESAEEGELKEYDSTGVLIRIADCQKGICLTRWKKEGSQSSE